MPSKRGIAPNTYYLSVKDFVNPIIFTLAINNKWYKEGTMIRVKNVAKDKPKITVHDIDPQKAALVPPK